MLTFPADNHVNSGIDVDAMLLFHRAPNNLITLHEKPGDGLDNWRDLCAFRVSELRNSISVLGDLSDCHFSINGFWGAKPVPNKNPRGHGFMVPDRSIKRLSELNAVFLDLDFQDVGMSRDQGEAGIKALYKEGQIPVPSIIGSNGHNLWLYWLLRSDNNALEPVHAFQQRVDQWWQIQNELFRQFAPLGADSHAKDIVRTTRIPGSLRTKTGTRIIHQIQVVDGQT